MRWRTYLRLAEKYERAQASWTVAFMGKLGFDLPKDE
jgi:hypothetical protein